VRARVCARARSLSLTHTHTHSPIANRRHRDDDQPDRVLHEIKVGVGADRSLKHEHRVCCASPRSRQHISFRLRLPSRPSFRQHFPSPPLSPPPPSLFRGSAPPPLATLAPAFDCIQAAAPSLIFFFRLQPPCTVCRVKSAGRRRARRARAHQRNKKKSHPASKPTWRRGRAASAAGACQ